MDLVKKKIHVCVDPRISNLCHSRIFCIIDLMYYIRSMPDIFVLINIPEFYYESDLSYTEAV